MLRRALIVLLLIGSLVAQAGVVIESNVTYNFQKQMPRTRNINAPEWGVENTKLGILQPQQRRAIKTDLPTLNSTGRGRLLSPNVLSSSAGSAQQNYIGGSLSFGNVRNATANSSNVSVSGSVGSVLFPSVMKKKSNISRIDTDESNLQTSSDQIKQNIGNGISNMFSSKSVGGNTAEFDEEEEFFSTSSSSIQKLPFKPTNPGAIDEVPVGNGLGVLLVLAFVALVFRSKRML